MDKLTIINEIKNNYIDSDFFPSLEKLNERKWAVLPVPDCMNLMEAEWLCEAIGEKKVYGLAFDYSNEIDTDLLTVDTHSIIKYVVENSHQFICITSDEVDFLYFKDDRNRFYLLCGSQEFVGKAYKCSRQISKEMYFDWVSNEFNNEEEKSFLKHIWDRYYKEHE